MIEPVTKTAAARMAGDFVTAALAGGVALTVTTEEVAMLVAAVVWFVRLEGRVTALTDIVGRIDRRQERMADHLGVVE